MAMRRTTPVTVPKRPLCSLSTFFAVISSCLIKASKRRITSLLAWIESLALSRRVCERSNFPDAVDVEDEADSMVDFALCRVDNEDAIESRSCWESISISV